MSGGIAPAREALDTLAEDRRPEGRPVAGSGSHRRPGTDRFDGPDQGSGSGPASGSGSDAGSGPAPIRIALIGAGPAGTMLLERIVANRAGVAPDARLEIHLIDPHRPGGGRIWRRDQSPLLKLNSMLEDVAFFTDPSCALDGPIAPGPSLAEWVRAVRAGSVPVPSGADAVLARELAEIGDRDFPTRRLNNAYLSWAFHETLRRAGERVEVQWHRDLAVAVAGEGPFRVALASGASLDVDLVVHALGHNGAVPSADARAHGAFAAEHGLDYVAPAFTADLDLSHVPAGSDVIVRGMGLAAVDLVVLLTEGRGGRFVRGDGGRLAYLPSGREPRLHLGSRRGVPYRSKITSRLAGEPVRFEYLGEEFHSGIAGSGSGSGSELDFSRDVWPLVAAELVTGFYRELFTGHPDRVRASWAEFAPRLRAALAGPRGWASDELAELVRAHVPEPRDRFDLEAFDRPLAAADPDPRPDAEPGLEPGAGAGVGAVPDSGPGTASDPVHERVRAHIERDLADRTEPERSATQGLFLTALHVYLSLAEVPPERWNAQSRTRDLPKRWHTFFSYVASGPPGHRLEELVALADAGVVRFLGGDLTIATDPVRGRFVATGSAAGTGRTVVSARTLIDAWLPESRAAASENPLLRSLIETGRAREVAVAPEPAVATALAGSAAAAAAAAAGAGAGAGAGVGAGSRAARGSSAPPLTTGRLEVAPDGRLAGAPRQFAVGPFVEGPTGGAFTRPGLNSLPFRVHDRCARALLAEVAALTPTPTHHSFGGTAAN